MNQQLYHITALNCLTGQREAISRPMSQEAATERLAAEKKNRRWKRNKAFAKLRVEKKFPSELWLEFDGEVK